MEEALREVRDIVLQYTKVADPTESMARQERVKQAEEKGQLEQSAARIARNFLAKQNVNHTDKPAKSLSPTSRIPATLRLGTHTIDPVEAHENTQDRELCALPNISPRILYHYA